MKLSSIPKSLLCALLALQVNLFAEDSSGPMAHETIQQVIRETADKIGSNYVFPELGEKIAKILIDRLQEGSYSGLDEISLAKTVSDDLLELSNDKHMSLRWVDPSGKSKKHRPRKTPAERNFGISKIELLEGNVRYLDLRGFVSLDHSEPYIEAAIQLLSTGSAIIFDVRKNGGGHPETVNLIFSYFMEPDIEYIAFFDREGNKENSYSTRTELKGERMLDMPVYVLTSNGTFSGGEEFAYNFKTYERGTLVGETTGGGANPGGVYQVGSGFGIFVPVARPLNPITNANWEGVGVVPDVEVPADEALEKALEIIREKQD
jgi:hypothetical protein